MARVTTLIYKATGRRSTSTGSVVVPTPTNQTVRPPLLFNDTIVYEPGLQQDNLLLLPLVENTQQFYGPVVSPAPVFVSPPLLANTEVIFPPTVNQTIQLPLVTNEQEFFAPQVVNGQALILPPVTNSQTFYDSQLNQRLDTPLLTNEQAFYGITVIQGTTVILPLLDNAQTFFGPQLNQKIDAPLVTNSQAFYSPTIVAGQVVRLPFWANGQAFFAPQVNQKVIAGFVNNTQTFYPPIVSANQLLVAPKVTNTQTFYGPSLNQKITAPLLTNTSTVFSPAVIRDDAQLISLPLTTNAQTFYGPTLKQQVRAPLFTNLNGIFPPSVQTGAIPGFPLSTPGIVVTSAAGEAPAIDLTINSDHYAGYCLDIQRSITGTKNVTDGSYASPTMDMNHMILPQEVAALAITNTDLAPDGYTDPPSGPWFQQYRIRREDGALSAWVEISGTVTVATTVLHTQSGFNKKSSCTVTGTPALVATGNASTGAAQCVRATNSASGKKQFQVTITSLPSNNIVIGLDNGTTDLNSGFPAPGITNAAGAGIRLNATGYSLWRAGSALSQGTTTFAAGDIISVAFDTTAGSASFYRTRSGSTTTIGTITGISQATWYAYIGTYTNASLTANFGQSAFARALDSGYSAY